MFWINFPSFEGLFAVQLVLHLVDPSGKESQLEFSVTLHETPLEKTKVTYHQVFLVVLIITSISQYINFPQQHTLISRCNVLAAAELMHELRPLLLSSFPLLLLHYNDHSCLLHDGPYICGKWSSGTGFSAYTDTSTRVFFVCRCNTVNITQHHGTDG
ncbi:hypothetical protein Pcinc_008158 [Petrolisthes cinctipes]|uniref:Uncharacterized protein n=1 Tax=Petrolisthes cinctipes TaxID=88211 RepID=A0AAE1KWQ9_PETCI|nr:hypothetical protein Pcinc_008158 [Petrolisthes cinctipes]